ncbi:MAG: amino acid adenylation domain-containing protein [Gloeocapsa sp. UFS-A4-WI-NPMV-4B04]|jgi:amino acid adenylation domain-containing protein|nr:amino acid adenylation domain-containing protein [Gloeocapsa sp. UFS-A4-WI-NPMV-4B04]
MAQTLNNPEIFGCSTWVDVLRYRTLHQPEQVAFTFLPDGETVEESLSYRELEKCSRAIAAQLQALGLSGERALLLYPPGLDYLVAFFGCLYAGVVAVPAYPPRNQRNTPRIQAVVADAQASIALTTTAILSQVQSLLAEKTDRDLQWLTTDSLTSGIEDSWQEPFINTDTLAFLQYTSGSTGTPKGAMLSHGNLLHNAAMTYRLMGHSPNSKFISWLPTYHDMGLIGGILQPLYGGFPCILMPPAAFLQRPYRWLQAISRYQGTTSGAPNFAYELCIHKITPEQQEQLDLSSWDVAFNGAEPIRQDTLERFVTKFAACGFRSAAFYPCYGMAEATLMVTGSHKTTPPVSKTIQKTALENNRAIAASPENENCTLVGCGQTLPDQQIIIANPQTCTSCLPGEVGEIWVSGPSIGHGYWNRPQETEQTFRAYLADTGAGPFLRTGDLGFLDNGELFVTGRAKDLIIVRGRNLYPQDIELTVERSHPALRLGSSAAFAVEVGNEERLVVVQELEFRAKPNLAEVTAAIRQAVAQEYEVQVYAVVLIKPGTIPKTSSGKIQRRACRADFLAGNLEVVNSSILIVEGRRQEVEGRGSASSLKHEILSSPHQRYYLLESYLREIVARSLKLALAQVNCQQPLSTLGLDSLIVFDLKNRIEVDLEVAVSVEDLFELSISQLATKIPELTTATSMPSVSLGQQQTDYPLSFAQARLWFLDQLETGNPAYNIAFALRLKGLLNLTVLEDSINEIVQRHEALRTTFAVVNGQPIQVIARVSLSVALVDCQEIPPSKRESQVTRLTTQEIQQPFDLTQGSLLRAKLLCLSQQEHILLLTMHHIVGDGWSAEVFLQEMAAVYKALLTNKRSPLPKLPIQYKDFAHWQRTWLQGEVLTTQLTYWQQQLAGATTLQLPTDHPRPAVQTYRGAQQSLELPTTLTEAVKVLSRQQGVTLFMLLLAAFQTFLYRYTGQDDISVGSPIANRNRDEIKGLIGFFVNTLVLRTYLGGNPSFAELLGRVRQVALGAYTYQDLPFEYLVEALQPERDVSFTPLFQVSFTLRNAPQMPEMPGLELSLLRVESLAAQFDLSLSIEITEPGLIASFEYNTDLFEAATITRMLGHFQNLLEGIVANPEQRLGELPLLNAAEQHQLLVEWNEEGREQGVGGNEDIKTHDSRLDLCVHQLFEAQVERTPDAVAVVFENQQLTYRELNNQANRIAHYLQQLGVKPEVLVGICMERSLEMVVGLLGILKAGGAYVPLDPAYPQERLAFMLADAQVPLLLSQQHLVIPPLKAQVVCLDSDAQALLHQSQENPISPVKPENLAYVIYTSGSTGTPKGVMNTHLGLSNRLLWMQGAYQLTASDRVLQKTPFSFDVSVWEFFWSLFTGARLVLAKPGGHQDSAYLVQLIAQQEISTLHFVPSMLQVFIEEPELEKCHSLKRVFCSGEALSVALQERFFERIDAELHNLYGPTEAAIDVTSWACQRGSNQRLVPIGRPIANTQIYLLDQHLKPVPIGVSGELHIGGVGLARGYLNRKELTDAKFISNPFSNEPEARLYKTGDLARYKPDGNIEFLGRIDYQVKLRGLRIELGEIEAVLSKHPAVREVVVLAREEASGKQLVAYVVPNQDQTPTTIELRNYLKERLPEYMLPAVFMLLDALPLTSNGKVDRRALPALEKLRPIAAEHQPPRSELEQAIASIWQEVLNLEKVGINDNFFDLGGHSLLMVQVNQKLRETLHRDLSIIELFKNPTINSLAQYLSQSSHSQPAFESLRNRVQKQLEERQKKVGRRR